MYIEIKSCFSDTSCHLKLEGVCNICTCINVFFLQGGAFSYEEDLGDSDDDTHDAYLQRVKREAAEKDSDFELPDESDEDGMCMAE